MSKNSKGDMVENPYFEELMKSFKNENSNMLGNIFLKILSSAFF